MQPKVPNHKKSNVALLPNVLVYSLLFLSTMAFSQREVPISSFSKIVASDQIDVVLIQTKDQPKILLNGAGSDVVEVIQKGIEIKIRMPLLKTLQGDNVSATVFYNGEVNQFEANEGARIASNDRFTGPSLRFIAKGGSEIQLKVETNKINVRAASGAVINLFGVAKNQEIVTNTGGEYQGEKLLTETTSIQSNTGGNAAVNATTAVDVKIFAGGVITVYGDPKKVSQKITGGGKIDLIK